MSGRRGHAGLCKLQDYRYACPPRRGFRWIAARLCIALLLYVAFSLLAETAAAGHAAAGDSAVAQDAARGAIWLMTGDDVRIEAIRLDTVADIDVSGPFVNTKIEQKFRNDSSLWAEGLYVFPLPEDAAVTGLRLRVGGRTIEGRMLERSRAQQTYERARDSGQRASLVEQQRPNVFSTRVSNIAPGAVIAVEIEYQQALALQDGYYQLRVPLVVGERYITPSRAGLRDPAYDLGVYTETAGSRAATNPVAISVDIDAGTGLSSIVSSSHPATVFHAEGDRYRVTLAGDEVPADRDFLLKWKPEPGPAPSAAVFSQADGDHVYRLVNITPKDRAYYTPHSVPREVIFILDVSGSMAGTSIEQAKSALIRALDRLGPADRFNIVWFSDRADSLFTRTEAATPGRLRTAQQFIDTLHAGGGTEMAPALQLALAAGDAPGHLQQVIFLTDGNVSNERDLLSRIRATLGDKRLFTVGIGSAPNSFFMKAAARAGRGTSTFISDIGDVAAETDTLFRKLESPALTDIEITLDGDDIEIFDEPLPDVYIGEPVSIVLRGKNLSNTLTIEGSIGADRWRRTLDIDDGEPNTGISTLWARRKIESLTAGYHEAGSDAAREFYRNQAIGVSHAHNVASRFTSLVAVDVTPVNDSGALYQQRLKNDRPHGWDPQQDDRTMVASIGLPQTATPLRLFSLLAVAFLSLGVAGCITRAGT